MYHLSILISEKKLSTMSDRESSGLLMSVIRTLHETDTGKEREDEKKKLEQQFKQCDQVMTVMMRR